MAEAYDANRGEEGEEGAVWLSIIAQAAIQFVSLCH
jgi:hypothetical protein